jgi:hypothetical protein
MCPYASSSYALSEPLNDHISAVDHYIASTRPEATMSYSTSLRQPPDHLPIDRSAVDEYKLVRPILNSDIFDKDTQWQENKNYNNDIEDGN